MSFYNTEVEAAKFGKGCEFQGMLQPLIDQEFNEGWRPPSGARALIPTRLIPIKNISNILDMKVSNFMHINM